MSYIFIDADEALRCAEQIKSKADGLDTLLGEQDVSGESGQKLEAFCRKLGVLSADLKKVTEDYVTMDEKMKALHIVTQEKRSGDHAK